MEFGSECILADIYNETEEIYQDEVDDGIASCAEEQAKIWAQEAQDDQEGTNSREFNQRLVNLLAAYKGGSGARQGALGTQTRLQPRFQKGKVSQYDQIVNQRLQEEAQRKSQKEAQLREQRKRTEQADKLAQYQQMQKQQDQTQGALPASAATSAPTPAPAPAPAPLSLPVFAPSASSADQDRGSEGISPGPCGPRACKGTWT
eukprot:TRINITY_DN1504_c0_g1_i4.p1 TRINITY_DN1504_c0_g1~~TRINITY_DN1504_c0_g1_i4.p1  ORF type:complete len:204 (-),score=55.09 TRINITY_DN1504_c0_g1_i4:66-677(-)